MKFLTKKIYIIIFILSIFAIQEKANALNKKNIYSRKNISNYFSGTISINNYYNKEAFQFLKQSKLIKNIHDEFNNKFLRTLILLEKFDVAFEFSKEEWKKDKFSFDMELLLGLNYFIQEDYLKAEKHFKRLNQENNNIFFANFIENILMTWTKAAQGNEINSFKFIDQIPSQFNHLKKTQYIFLKCYFNHSDVDEFYKNTVQDKNYDFSRYNFFLANHLLFKNKTADAKRIIANSRKKFNSNLLLKETENFLLSGKNSSIKNFYDCKNPKDSLAEFFYLIANLYSSDKNYQQSNYYLKISLLLNNKFLTNGALLAENLYYQEKYQQSLEVYEELKLIGPEYKWHASKNIAKILTIEKGKSYSSRYLEKQFNLIKNLTFEHHYELANFYKNNEYLKESIKHYTLALNQIEKDHFLVPIILDRRGTSFEKLGDWKKGENDLIASIKITPDDAHVLNYLAYTWIDKGINLDKGLAMLEKANEIKKFDGYITDSLGWAYYAKKNYVEAEKYLQKAVELLPFDPIIADHYADTLWMLNKNIQARYFWNQILKLKGAEKELKENINKKLIFGIIKKS